MSEHAGSFAQRPVKFLRGVIVSVVLIGALILPWTILNAVTFQDFLLLNSNGGYWLYASNHPGQGTNFNHDFSPPIPANLANLKEPALDRALMQEGLRFIIADPQRFLLLSISRLKDYYWILPTDSSSPLANVSRLASFAVYLPFMLYGLWLSRKQWRLCLPLYLYVAFDALLCLTTWSAPRYRLPSDVVLMVFVGLAVEKVTAQVRHRLAFVSATRSAPRNSLG